MANVPHLKTNPQAAIDFASELLKVKRFHNPDMFEAFNACTVALILVEHFATLVKKCKESVQSAIDTEEAQFDQVWDVVGVLEGIKE